jgi:mono/diheme cytochrome c family protein
VRATILAAGGLACAGAAMTIAAFAGGGTSEDPQPAPAGAPAREAPRAGLDVWIEQGCGSCHTFKPANSSAPIGPDLQLSLHDKSRDYVTESIVLPNAKAAAGHTTGSMPEDYATRISPQELDALVDFLMEGARQ